MTIKNVVEIVCLNENRKKEKVINKESKGKCEDCTCEETRLSENFSDRDAKMSILEEMTELNSKYSKLDPVKNVVFELKSNIKDLARTDYLNVGEKGYKKVIEQGEKGVILGEDKTSNALLIHFVDDTVIKVEEKVVKDCLELLSFVPNSWTENVIDSYPKVRRKLKK